MYCECAVDVGASQYRASVTIGCDDCNDVKYFHCLFDIIIIFDHAALLCLHYDGHSTASH